MRSLSYLAISLQKSILRQGRGCPSCGCTNRNAIIDRKWGITTLRRCARCRLLFRVPTTTDAENEKIYQELYQEGSTTELPDAGNLQGWIETRFKGSPHDHSAYIAVLSAVGVTPGARVYDFGCSWGYGAFQLKAEGFAVEGYEIAEARARYAADKLGVVLRRPADVPDAYYDVFFSAHVMEHVPSVRETLTLADRVLRPGGFFVAFTPNGSLERRLRDPASWHQQWGFVHPQLLDREWIERLGRPGEILTDTTPYDMQALRAGRSPANFEGGELLVVIRKAPAQKMPQT